MLMHTKSLSFSVLVAMIPESLPTNSQKLQKRWQYKSVMLPSIAVKTEEKRFLEAKMSQALVFYATKSRKTVIIVAKKHMGMDFLATKSYKTSI